MFANCGRVHGGVKSPWSWYALARCSSNRMPRLVVRWWCLVALSGVQAGDDVLAGL